MRRFTQLFSLLTTASTGFSTLNAAEINAQIRVNQAGFLVNDTKQALLMATGSESNAIFKVVSSDGPVALTASVGNKIGSWSTVYTNIYLLDFSSVKKAGIYSIKVYGGVLAVSPSFQIGTGSDVYAPLLRNSLFFFQAQRDGADVSSAVINRKPSHLTDKQAFVYKVPALGKKGMQGGLEKIGGPVEISGGWFDAGDYLKFVQTASYVTAMMLQGARDYPAQMGQIGRA